MNNGKRSLNSCNVPDRAARRFESPFAGTRRGDEGRVGKRINTAVRQRLQTQLRLEQRLQTMQEPEEAVQWAQSFVRRSRALLGRLRDEDMELQRQLSKDWRQRVEQAAHVERILADDSDTGGRYDAAPLPTHEEIAIESDGSANSMRLEFELDGSQEELGYLQAHAQGARRDSSPEDKISSYSSESSGIGGFGSSDYEEQGAQSEEYAASSRGDEALQLLALQAIDSMSAVTNDHGLRQDQLVGSLALPENIDSASEFEYDIASASPSGELLLGSPDSVAKMGSSGMNTPTSAETASPEASDEEIADAAPPQQLYSHLVSDSDRSPDAESDGMDEVADQDGIHTEEYTDASDDVIEVDADPYEVSQTENKSSDRDYARTEASDEIIASPMSSDGTYFSYREDTAPPEETARAELESQEPRTYRLIYTGSAYSENSQDAEPPHTDFAEYSSAFAENPFKEENQQIWDREALQTLVKQLHMKYSDRTEAGSGSSPLQPSKEQGQDTDMVTSSSSVAQVPSTVPTIAAPAISPEAQTAVGSSDASRSLQISAARLAEQPITASMTPERTVTQNELPFKTVKEKGMVVADLVTNDSLGENGLVVEQVSEESSYNGSPEVMQDPELLVEAVPDKLEIHEVASIIQDGILASSSMKTSVDQHNEKCNTSTENSEPTEHIESPSDTVIDSGEQIDAEPSTSSRDISQRLPTEGPSDKSVASSENVYQEGGQFIGQMEYDTKKDVEYHVQSPHRNESSSEGTSKIVPVIERPESVANSSSGVNQSPYFGSSGTETHIYSAVAPIKGKDIDKDDNGVFSSPTGTHLCNNSRPVEQAQHRQFAPKLEDLCERQSSSSEDQQNTDMNSQSKTSVLDQATIGTIEERRVASGHSVPGTPESDAEEFLLAESEHEVSDKLMGAALQSEAVAATPFNKAVPEQSTAVAAEGSLLGTPEEPAKVSPVSDGVELYELKDKQGGKGCAVSSTGKYQEVALIQEDAELLPYLVEKPTSEIVFEEPVPFSESSAKAIINSIKERETYSRSTSREVKSSVFGGEHLNDLDNVVFEHPAELDLEVPLNSVLEEYRHDVDPSTSFEDHNENQSYEAEVLDIPCVGTLSTLAARTNTLKDGKKSEVEDDIAGKGKGSSSDPSSINSPEKSVASVDDQESAESSDINSNTSAVSMEVDVASQSEIPVEAAVDEHSPDKDKVESSRPHSAGRLIEYSVHSLGSLLGKLKGATTTAKELVHPTGGQEHAAREAVDQIEHTCPGRWLAQTDSNNVSDIDRNETPVKVDPIVIRESSAAQQEPIVIDSDEYEGELEVQSVPTTPIRSSEDSNQEGIIARIRGTLSRLYPPTNTGDAAPRTPVCERIFIEDDHAPSIAPSDTQAAAQPVASDMERLNPQASSPRSASRHFGARTEETREITTKSLMVSDASAATVRSTKEKKRSVRRRKRPINDDSAIHVGKRRKVHADDSVTPRPTQGKQRKRSGNLKSQKKQKRRLRPRTK
ncbi:FAER353Wp [Eremothecium gossypii FDAG1]|nr:FAER353Wp [Eremothecium gossypii FDAG1]